MSAGMKAENGVELGGCGDRRTSVVAFFVDPLGFWVFVFLEIRWVGQEGYGLGRDAASGFRVRVGGCMPEQLAGWWMHA